ncbi:MAG: tetratricopeptide (TPR) repeat protein [Rhodothermales bacterium]|jgi:tetratricopeptide (TPR) repeat protein
MSTASLPDKKKANRRAVLQNSLMPAWDSWPDRQFAKFAALVIAGLTLIVYTNSLHNEFTNWDDNHLVVENESIRSLSPSNIIDIFTPRPGSTFQPVRVLSYAVNYSLHEFEPFGYHLVNTVLHGIGAFFLFLLLSAGLDKLRAENTHRSNRVIALFVALIFLSHPVNVESVAWISSRKYGLLGVFYFAAFWLYIKASGGETLDRRCLAGSVVCCLLAVLSSPFGITLPAMIIAYDYCRHDEISPLSGVRKYWPAYLLLGICAAGVVPLLMNLAGMDDQPDLVKTHHSGNPINTFLTVCRALFDYGWNLVVPIALNNRYPDKIETGPNFKIIATLCSIGLLAFYLFCDLRKGRKLFLFCAVWFFACWAPVSNIIPISTFMADRYMYLAAIGFFLAVGLIADSFLRREGMPSWAPPAVLGGILALLALLSIQRNTVWANSIALWTDSIQKDGRNYLAHNSLGIALADEERYDEALVHYQTAMDRNKNYSLVYYNLGSLYQDTGRLEDAVLQFEKYVKMEPENADGWMNLGTVLGDLKRFDEAIEKLQEGLKLRPEGPRVNNNVANVYTLAGRPDEAEPFYQKAIELDPDFAEAFYNYGTFLADGGQREESLPMFLKAIKLREDYADPHNNMGNVLRKLGRLDEAIAHYRKALEMMPDEPAIHNNIAVAYRDKGMADQATFHSQRATQLSPENAEMHYRAGTAKMKQGQLDGAKADYEKALAIEPTHAGVNFRLGEIHRMRNNAPAAMAHYLKAVESNPNLVTAHYNLGTLYGSSNLEKSIYHYEQSKRGEPNTSLLVNLGAAYFQAKQADKAIAVYEEALVADPQLYQAHLNLGIALQQLGKEAEAISHYETALKIRPKQPRVSFSLGLLYRQREEWPKALAHFADAVRDDRNSVDPYRVNLQKYPALAESAKAWFPHKIAADATRAEFPYMLGMAHSSLKEREAALARYKAALAVDPNFLEAQMAAGAEHFILGDGKSALPYYLAAAKQRPQSPELQNNIGSAYFSTGDFASAVKHYKAALVLRPNYASATENLAKAQAALGK